MNSRNKKWSLSRVWSFPECMGAPPTRVQTNRVQKFVIAFKSLQTTLFSKHKIIGIGTIHKMLEHSSCLIVIQFLWYYAVNLSNMLWLLRTCDSQRQIYWYHREYSIHVLKHYFYLHWGHIMMTAAIEIKL